MKIALGIAYLVAPLILSVSQVLKRTLQSYHIVIVRIYHVPTLAKISLVHLVAAETNCTDKG
jgi:hypothetical protein